MTTVATLLKIATLELGYKENPLGSNKTKYGIEFGMDGVSWCAIFVWWVFKHSNLELPVKTAGCAVLVSDFRHHNRFSKLPVPGAVFFCGTYGQDHTGIVETVDKDGLGFTTIEGNSDPAGSYNGTMVCRRHRRVGDGRVYGFGIPVYTQEQPVRAWIGPSVEYGDNMKRTEFKTLPLDKDGNGFIDTQIPFDKLINILPNGPSPDRDGGYDNSEWPDWVWSWNNTNNQARIVIEGGCPGRPVQFVAWSVS